MSNNALSNMLANVRPFVITLEMADLSLFARETRNLDHTVAGVQITITDSMDPTKMETKLLSERDAMDVITDVLNWTHDGAALSRHFTHWK